MTDREAAARVGWLIRSLANGSFRGKAPGEGVSDPLCSSLFTQVPPHSSKKVIKVGGPEGRARCISVYLSFLQL